MLTGAFFFMMGFVLGGMTMYRRLKHRVEHYFFRNEDCDAEFARYRRSEAFRPLHFWERME